MDEKKQAVKRHIMELRKNFGDIIAIDELLKLGVRDNIGKEEVGEAIKSLEEEGIIRIIDDDSIEVNS